MDNYGFLSLVPPLIAIILAIRTKQVFISLITGIFVGWLIIGDWNLFKGILFTIDGIVNVFSDKGNTRVVLFTFLVGSLITFIQISGGIAGFIDSVKNRMIIFPTSKRHAGTTHTDTMYRCVINFNWI